MKPSRSGIRFAASIPVFATGRRTQNEMDETGDLDQLERQTAQLRRQMALDVDELVRRVNPRRFVSTAVAYTRKTQPALRTAADAMKTAADAMKQDPIPYLIIGVGVAGTVWAATSLRHLR